MAKAKKAKKPKPFPVEMGVKELDEEQALDLCSAIRDHFGWSGTYFMRSDAESHAGRALTDEEWECVRESWPWHKGLPEILCERGWSLVDSALEEAGVERKDEEV